MLFIPKEVCRSTSVHSIMHFSQGLSMCSNLQQQHSQKGGVNLAGDSNDYAAMMRDCESVKRLVESE